MTLAQAGALCVLSFALGYRIATRHLHHRVRDFLESHLRALRLAEHSGKGATWFDIIALRAEVSAFLCTLTPSPRD